MEKSTEEIPLIVRDCVGCGFCCIKTQCDVSYRLYKTVEVCPQLQWHEDESRYKCGLMLLPGNLGFEYRKELYAGAGCCSGLNDWRRDVKKRSRGVMSHARPIIPAMFQAFLKAYGSEPFISGDATTLILSNYASQLKAIEYSEEEINYIIGSVEHYITSNKTSMFKGFM